MIDLDMANSPESYARGLASYIKDPSTIRARTLDYWGRAPSVEKCRQMIEAQKPAEYLPPLLKFTAGKGWKCDHPRTEENVILRETGNVVCKTCYRQMQAQAARKYRARLQNRSVAA